MTRRSTGLLVALGVAGLGLLIWTTSSNDVGDESGDADVGNVDDPLIGLAGRAPDRVDAPGRASDSPSAAGETPSPPSPFARAVKDIRKRPSHTNLTQDAADVYAPPADRVVWRDALMAGPMWASGSGQWLVLATRLVEIATLVGDPGLAPALFEGVIRHLTMNKSTPRDLLPDFLGAVRIYLLKHGDVDAADALARRLRQTPTSDGLILVAREWAAWESTIDMSDVDAALDGARPADRYVQLVGRIDTEAGKEGPLPPWWTVRLDRMDEGEKKQLLLHAFAEMEARDAALLLRRFVSSGQHLDQATLNGLASEYVQTPGRRGELADVALALAEALLEAKTPQERLQIANGLYPIPADDLTALTADRIREYLRRTPKPKGDVTEHVARAQVFAPLARTIDHAEMLDWAEGAATRGDSGVLGAAFGRLVTEDALASNLLSQPEQRARAARAAAWGLSDDVPFGVHRTTYLAVLRLIRDWRLVEARASVDEFIARRSADDEVAEVARNISALLSD